jgi:hypothetical protein
LITALILAAVVAGQISESPSVKTPKPHGAINQDYVPKVRDAAQLGCVDLDVPENNIERAWCFSTIERAREGLNNNQAKHEDGIVSPDPDGYLPRAGTMIIIEELVIVDFVSLGEARKAVLPKVRVLEGEFKGRVFFTSIGNVFRFVHKTDTPPVGASSNKKAGRRGAQAAVPADAKLVLTDLVTNSSGTGKYLNVDGRFRCTSKTPLQFVRATISFEDQKGNLVRSEDTACTPHTLNPGDVGSFSAMPESDSRYARMKIVFKDSLQSIPWSDQSGRNAHE